MPEPIYFLSSDLYQQLLRLLKKMDNVRGPGVVNTRDGITINPSSPPRTPQTSNPKQAWPAIITESGANGTNWKWAYGKVDAATGTQSAGATGAGECVIFEGKPGCVGLCGIMFYELDADGNTKLVFMPSGVSFKARIVAVSGSFPVWTYWVQHVRSYNSTLTAFNKWVSSVEVTAYNGCEWDPGAYPYVHGCGVMVQDSTGLVATTFAGGTASTCRIRPIVSGTIVDVTPFFDESGNIVYMFSMPNSSQPD